MSKLGILLTTKGERKKKEIRPYPLFRIFSNNINNNFLSISYIKTRYAGFIVNSGFLAYFRL